MTSARKLVLLKLADLIDGREGNTAYPAFNTLAEYAGVSRDTAIRAVNIGKKIGLLIRVKGAGKKGAGGTSNRYGFRLKEVTDALPLSDVRGPKEVAGVPRKRSQACIERGSRPATQQSKDNLIDSLKGGSASSAASESVVGVAQERGSGEEGRESKPSLDNRIAEPAEMPKQTDAELCIEMAAKGMDMSQSKLRRHQPREVYSAPRVPDERPITIGQTLIDQIKKKGAAA
jgi:hypothetical protein